MSSRAWCLFLAAIWGGLGVTSGAVAQTRPQFDLNQFRPSELTTDGFALSHADGQGHLRFGVQVYFDYARDPLELQVTNGPIPDQRLPLVHSQLTGHLTWNLGLWERLVIFMDLPYTFILKDSVSDEGTAFLESIGQGLLLPAGRGLGDLYVGARGVLYGTRENIFQLAAQATLTTNTASASRPQQNYLGEPDKSPNIGGWFEALATFNAGDYVRIPLNVGYKTSFRQDIPSLEVGNQLTFGAGVQLLLGEDRFMITMETFGRTAAAVGTGFGGRQETPVELLGGFKYLHPKGLAVGIAGTGGVTSGYGNPDWRLIAMLGYTMPEKERAVVRDADGDGIVDERDGCPNDPVLRRTRAVPIRTVMATGSPTGSTIVPTRRGLSRTKVAPRSNAWSSKTLTSRSSIRSTSTRTARSFSGALMPFSTTSPRFSMLTPRSRSSASRVTATRPAARSTT
jgi:hypothetical protein